MGRIDTIIILLTPFHKKVLWHLFPDAFNNENTLILHAGIISVNEYKCHKQELIAYNFSRKKIFKSPIQYLKPFRKKVNSIKEEIKLLDGTYDFSNKLRLYFCSDKDIFSQILLQKLNFNTILAVDEGLAFYVRLSLKDHVIAILYRILTPILFGQRLYYIKRAAMMPQIDIVYLRKIDLLPRQKKGIVYKEFHLKSAQKIREIKPGEVLFFSFPEQYFLFDPKKKILLQRNIADYLEKHGKKLVIKPHPSENVTFLLNGLADKENVVILEGNQLGEELDYFKYELIFNIFSSIILDVIDSLYPKERLITLGFPKLPPMKFDGSLKYFNIHQFKIEEHIEFET